MRCLLVAINSKYIHSNPAVYLLRECALRDLKQKQIFGVEVELAEYTINHHASEIFDDIYLHHADLVCFSCYIWNSEYVRQLVQNLKISVQVSKSGLVDRKFPMTVRVF